MEKIISRLIHNELNNTMLIICTWKWIEYSYLFIRGRGFTTCHNNLFKYDKAFTAITKIVSVTVLKHFDHSSENDGVTPPCIRIKRFLHFLNAVIGVQIQQTVVCGEGQEVDTGTCCSEEHSKSLWSLVLYTIYKLFTLVHDWNQFPLEDF